MFNQVSCFIMTKKEFQTAFDIAKSDEDLSNHDASIFFGCASKDFQPITCTAHQLARFIRWQALMLNGDWDSDALDEIRQIGKTKFNVLI